MASVAPLPRSVFAAALLCLWLPATSVPAGAESPPGADAVTADGGRYYGPLVNGRLQGRGRIEWESGARYEGDLVDGRMSGKGRLVTAGGDRYEGEFRAGEMSGAGRLELADGSVYTGAFVHNVFSGQGRLVFPDGEVYEGAFEKGLFSGEGRFESPELTYRGAFRLGRFWGQGEMRHADGRTYRGGFERGRLHGQGRAENPAGEVFEGDFVKDEFTGKGTHTRKDGSRHEGAFLAWRPHGPGRFIDANGDVYEGNFVNGELVGLGRLTGKRGGRYAGEFKQWRFDGQGVLQLPNGDEYKGGFAGGLYDGEGTLTYGKPRPDGRTTESGVWRYGALVDEAQNRQARTGVETALYSQRRLLDQALASMAPPVAGQINMYLLAVAGDGGQEVFRREVEFVREQFDRRFATRGRSLALINSRHTQGTAPMATITSLRESLQGIAARMDKERDILFLFLTSHGSREHEFVLDQNGMDLRSLPARELGQLLKESGIRWRVVVVSACYAGGFIDHLQDEHTLVITAARHDRQSFGCADDNDFTYFGRAFFHDALPRSQSFEEAFRKAEVAVREWELKETAAAQDSAADASGEDVFSLPQISAPRPISQHLQRWWAQLAKLPAAEASPESRAPRAAVHATPAPGDRE